MQTKQRYAGRFILPLFILIFGTISCVDLGNLDDLSDPRNLELDLFDAEYAIPLINSTVTLDTFLADKIEIADLYYDDDGVAVLRYSADVLRKEAHEVFTPITFPGIIPFIDSTTSVRFDQIGDFIVQKGTFAGDSIRFGFTSPFNEAITVSIKIKELDKNGEPFNKVIELAPNESIITPFYGMEGYDFEAPDNKLTFVYDARKANGERVLLTSTFFQFTQFVFDFIQGFLGKNLQNLQETEIKVDVFDIWDIQQLEFYDPKITVRLDNSFGFPVNAVFHKLEMANDMGTSIEMTSTIFDEDVSFGFPGLDQIGEVVTSHYVFDRSNSNIREAFNQRITSVTYDIDALANPYNDDSVIGFFTSDSYYLLNVTVEVPMIFKAKNFELSDQFSVDSIPVDLDLVEEFELKTYMYNQFPIESYVQMYLMDENEMVIDSIFEDGPNYFPPAIENSDGSYSPHPDTEPVYSLFTGERLNNLEKTRHFSPSIRLSSPQESDTWAKITKDLGVNIKMGAKFKLK